MKKKKEKKKEKFDKLIRKLRENIPPPLDESLKIKYNKMIEGIATLIFYSKMKRVRKEWRKKTEEEMIEHFEDVIERIMLEIEELQKKKEEGYKVQEIINTLIKSKEELMWTIRFEKIMLALIKYGQNKKKKKEDKDEKEKGKEK